MLRWLIPWFYITSIVLGGLWLYFYSNESAQNQLEDYRAIDEGTINFHPRDYLIALAIGLAIAATVLIFI